MSGSKIALFCVLGFIGVIILIAISSYNSMVGLHESVVGNWANVENQYKRRFDLIPNLVKTVKGYAEHEKTVFEEITNARAKVGSIQIDPNKLSDEKSFNEFQKNQDNLGVSLSRLIAVSENYPTLKADKLFSDLQAQIEGTENRIATERFNYNESVKKYNAARKIFPTVFFAAQFGYSEDLQYFKLNKNEESMPVIDFGVDK